MNLIKGLIIVLMFSTNLLVSQNPWFDLATYNSLKETKEVDPLEVQKLILKGEKLTKFPEELRAFKNLKFLDLTKNKIDHIPSWINELNQLECLILNKNDIDSLPQEFYQLTSLKVLQLGSNQVSVITKDIVQLQNLEVLDLWNNDISHISDDIKKLEKLKRLDLRAILFNQEEQDRLRSLIPNVIIDFDPPCNCSY